MAAQTGRLTVSILAVALALTLNASAHHGTSFFSRDQVDMVTVQGRVTRFDFRSPHSYLYVETTEASGTLLRGDSNLFRCP